MGAESTLGAAIERTWGRTLGALPPGGRTQVELGGELSAELSGKATLRAGIEERPDGSVEVTLGGGASVGLGADAGLGKARVGLGMGGEVSWLFTSREEAARGLGAVTQAWLGHQLPLSRLVLDDDLSGRLLGVARRTARAQLELGVDGQVEVQGGLARAELQVAGQLVATLDVENRQLVLSGQLVLGGEAELGLQRAEGGPRLAFAGLGGEVETKLALRHTFPLDDALVRRLQDAPGELPGVMRRLKETSAPRTELVAELVGSGAGLELRGQVAILWEPLARMDEQLARLAVARGDWQLSRVVDGFGLSELPVDVPGVELEAAVSSRQSVVRLEKVRADEVARALALHTAPPPASYVGAQRALSQLETP